MKRVIYFISGISVLVLGLLIFVVVAGNIQKNSVSELYEHYQFPGEDFFGKTLYSEIDYEYSADEAEVANEILVRAIQVAEYTGTEQDSDTQMGDVGALSKYYLYNSKDAAAQNVSFELITCKITDDKGHIWVASTISRYGEDGQYAPGGGRDILTLWYIEHQDQEWKVMQVKECP